MAGLLCFRRMVRSFLINRGVGVALVALFLVALFTVAGCGDDDDSQGSSAQAGAAQEATIETGSLSKDEFIEQIDEVCQGTQKELLDGYKEIVTEGTGGNSPDAQREVSEELAKDVVLPATDKLIEEIQETGAPSGDESSVQDLLDALEADQEYVEAQPVKSVGSVTPYVRSVKTAESYGLSGCAEALG